MPSKLKHAAIIGAGLSGLAASRDLLNSGWQVTLCETGHEPGGLASSFQWNGQAIERYYHFICRPDTDLFTLAEELGLQDRIHWRPTKTSFYFDGNTYPFASPFDLLRFRPVPLLQRLRFGLHVAVSRYRSGWKDLDGISARDWLTALIGEQAYNVIWHPLLQVKFGDFSHRISAAWLWHRIWRVARSRRNLLEAEMMGYFEGGSATIVNSLWQELQTRQNFTFCGQTAVQEILVQGGSVVGVRTNQGEIACDTVLSTVALPVLDKLTQGRGESYFEKARQVHYIGLVCMVLNLDRSFSPAFWTNVHDPRISFNGLIEYTNLNYHLRQAGIHLLYIPFYLPVSEARFKMKDDDILEEYIQALQWINPAFERSWIRDWRVFRENYAQAICTSGFSDLIPSIQTPVTGLYVTDSTQFYPEDRSISAAIRMGRRAAKLMTDDHFV